MIIYVVEGGTGEYSDREYWLVKAFVNEEAAKELVVKASARAREIQIERQRDNRWYYADKGAVEFINQFDPQMEMNYTGTYYSYYPVELDGIDSTNLWG